VCIGYCDTFFFARAALSSAPDFAELRQRIERGEIESALTAARACLPYMQGKARGDALLVIAAGSNTRGDYVEGVRAAVAATESFEAAGERGGVCDAMVGVATALRCTGDYASAIETLEQAEALARAAGDNDRLGSALHSLGVCCSLLGRHQQALSCLQEALTLRMAHGAVHDQMATRQSLYNAQSRFAHSLPQDAAQRAAIFTELTGAYATLAADCERAGLLRPQLMAQGNHAIMLHSTGHHQESAAQLTALLPRYRAQGMRPNEAISYTELGHCARALGQLHTARDHYATAVEHLRNAGTLDDLQEALQGLADVEEQLGNDRAALQALKTLRDHDKRRTAETARQAVTQRELRIELARLTNQWAKQATQDPLTGLGNRRALERWLREALAGAERGAPLTLLLMDLDHFKHVNDRFGHDVGDQVLRRVAGVIAQSCRSSDQAVRYGGEEFVLGLASVGYEDAVQIAHRVRASVQAQPWQDIAHELAVSVSIGIASAREAAEATALLTLADKRLYAAKYAGRNQVVMAG
jgi:diguanylate cyclase (GGDEF)-like protein